MTPEERFAEHQQWLREHEQWLRDHNRAIAEHDREMAAIRATLAETTEMQRRQSAVLVELTQHVTRLLERWDQADNGAGPQP